MKNSNYTVMKKISILLFAFVAALCFNACIEDEDPTFVLQQEQTEGPLIVSANSTIALSKENEDLQGFTLVWEDAQYNVNTPISYSIEAAAAGTDFATPLEVAVTTDRFYSWTIGELNSLAILLGLEADNEASFELRVVSSLGTNGGASIISNPIALTVTPYSTIIVTKNLFLVGNTVDTNKDGVANNDDWNNGATNTYLFRDPDNSNIFYFRGFFEFNDGENEFKLLENKGFWQPQWGLDGGGFTSSDILGGDPGAFTIGSSGYYELIVNIDELTHELNSIDITGATEYTTIGFIGSARTGDDTGWGGDDTDLIQSPFNPHIWYAENVTLFDGALKFRHSNDWPGNWGGPTPLTGQATTEGNPPDTPVIAGTYDIWFNDLDGRYIFVPRN